MEVLAAVAVGIFIYALYRRVRLWKIGRPDDRFSQMGKRAWAFFWYTIFHLLLHGKLFGVGRGAHFREFYPGVIHFLIFSGCAVLFVGTVLVAASHYIYDFLEGNVYLAVSLGLDIFGLLLIIGILMAMYRRYVQKPDRLDNRREDLIALLLLLFLAVSGFVVEGLRIAATELKTSPEWAAWSPGGYLVALGLRGLGQTTLLSWHQAIWWLHSLAAIATIIYVSLTWNRLWHIIVSPLNVFLRNLEARGALVPIDMEAAETFGVDRIQNFTWKHLLDLDACTRCGRCQDSCPAYLSGKPLSPKKVIQDLRGHLVERALALRKRKAGEQTPEDNGRMIGGVVVEDEIWNCTTCYACQEVCPVYVEPMVKLVEMRRNLVMEQATVPETGEGALKCLETRGHPWRGTTLSRTDWAEGLEVRTLADDSDVDILFWVGCTEALEERSTRVAQAIAGILKAAGVNFGILGAEEVCCGDPARRLGNEYLFQMQAQQNIELLNNYGIRKIVTGCPHCYNTLKNEYPQFSGKYEIVHHTEFIASLIREGRLPGIKRAVDDLVTYQDSCYLGRYNGIYNAPRRVLRSLDGVKLVEMARNLEHGFCCGAGGGHLWLEEQKTGERINEMRTEQALTTKAGVIATACPYCLQMFEDGIQTKEAAETAKAMDIAELVMKAMS